MFKIDTSSKIIEATRGDRGTINFKMKSGKFAQGDKLVLSICENGNYQNVLFQKEYIAEEETDTIPVTMTSEDTRFGDPISKETDYVYEVQYNDDITIIGSDQDGDKTFMLYPEAADKEDTEESE